MIISVMSADDSRFIGIALIIVGMIDLLIIPRIFEKQKQIEKIMTDLTDLTIAGALNGLKNKEFSAVELTNAHITAVENARGLNAFITETPEIAQKQAEESDARYKADEARALDGIPIGMKIYFVQMAQKQPPPAKF